MTAVWVFCVSRSSRYAISAMMMHQVQLGVANVFRKPCPVRVHRTQRDRNALDQVHRPAHPAAQAVAGTLHHGDVTKCRTTRRINTACLNRKIEPDNRGLDPAILSDPVGHGGPDV